MIFLLLHAGYSSFYVGLFSKNQMLGCYQEDKRFASKNMALRVAELLKIHNIAPDALSCIAVDCGPGPFTSTRTAVATANGIAFGTKLPIIELNSFDALIASYPSIDTATILAIYNGYNNDLYYALKKTHDQKSIIGYIKQELLITQLIPEVLTTGPLTIIGQGVDLISNQITATYQNRITTDHSRKEPTIEALAAQAIKKYENALFVGQATPIYLKTGYNL